MFRTCIILIYSTDCDIENIAIWGGPEITKTVDGLAKKSKGGVGKGLDDTWMTGEDRYEMSDNFEKHFARYPVNGNYGSWFSVIQQLIS